jgi:BirA family biotin operon repressor/biotin-[acetyl-CoA-carboxylase] ligase
VEANAQFIISRIASLAVKNTLDQFTDDIRIKWPNDIYWKDKKIAGILIENDISGRVITNSIIGIGININQDQFPEELPNPVSLKQVTGSEFDRDYILDNFVREFFLIYREFQNGNEKAIEDEYMLDLYRINDYYWFEDDNGRFKAIIKEVLPSGHLVLKTLETAEERVYAFKEVSFVD